MADSIFSDSKGMHGLLFMHMRHAFKTGLAAALAYGISSLLGSRFGLWAVISTLIVMQGISVADSIQASLSRFTMMSLGALAGMLILIISPPHDALLTAEVFCICALGAYLGRYGNRFTLATTAVCIVLLVGQYSELDGIRGSVMFGLTLSLEVLLGVLCAVGVTALLWPVRLGDTLREDIAAQCEKCAALLDTVTTAYLDHQNHLPYHEFDGLNLQTHGNRERLDIVRRLESHLYHYALQGLEVRARAVEQCVESMRALLDVLNEYDEAPFDPLMARELRALADALILALRRLGARRPPLTDQDLAAGLTEAVNQAEARLESLRDNNALRPLPLHRVLQLYTFYQNLRHLAEKLRLALNELKNG